MKTNNKYLNEFLLCIKNQDNLADNTISSYECDLKEMLQYMKKIKTPSKLEVENINIDDISKEVLQKIEYYDLLTFINYLTDDKRGKHNKQDGEATRSRKVTSIKRFFDYLLEMNYIKNNPSLKLKKPKLDKNLPVNLTLDESKKMLNIIDGANKERDFTIVTLFLNCGLRLSELVSIDIDRIKGDTLVVKGKGSKERTIYLNEACLKAIEEYLKVRPNINDTALFLSERNQRVCNKTVQRIVKKYLELAGLDINKFSTHTLRHSAATLLYKYGNVGLGELQEILGHENINTTRIYAHVDSERLRDAVKANPLNVYKEDIIYGKL